MLQKILLALLIVAFGVEVYILVQRTHFFIDKSEAHDVALDGVQNVQTPIFMGEGNDLLALPKTTISIGNDVFDVWIAQTPQSRMLGLSHQTSLGEKQGMLFVFDAPGIYPFWMKDTKIPLDIIWISEDKKIVDIATLAAPTDATQAPLVYGPKTQARYVLEINAGLSEQFGINIGDAVVIGEMQKNNAVQTQELPTRFIIDNVPFAVQAPFAKWYHPYEEACEEATLLMAVRYFEGRTTLSPSEIDADLLKIVAYEEKTFGHYINSDIKEVARILDEFFGYKNYEIRNNATLEDIKHEIVKGNLILLPAEGRLLKNPYFVQPGPPYHTVLVHGYDDTTQEFITHDPGTARGANFRYSYEIIANAWHDWTGDEATILQGARDMLVIKPK